MNCALSVRTIEAITEIFAMPKGPLNRSLEFLVLFIFYFFILFCSYTKFYISYSNDWFVYILDILDEGCKIDYKNQISQAGEFQSRICHGTKEVRFNEVNFPEPTHQGKSEEEDSLLETKE